MSKITESDINKRVEVQRISGGVLIGTITGMFDGDDTRCWVKFKDDGNQHICFKKDLTIIGGLE